MFAMLLAGVLAQAPALWAENPVVGSAPTLFDGGSPPAAAKPNNPEYAKAFAQAQQGDTLVVLVGASWCGPCKKMEAELGPVLKGKAGVAYVHLDYQETDAGPYMKGSTVPQLAVWKLVNDKWANQHRIGYQSPAAVLGIIASMEKGPATKAEPPTPPTAKRQRGNWNGFAQWTWPGYPNLDALESHLIGTHGEDVDQLASMSNGQLVQTHASIHNATKVVSSGRRGFFGRRR